MLTTTFDMIDETHREAGDKLVDWVVKNYKTARPIHVTVICTGNSRRSIIGATMGNIATSYYGMPEIRFHSGGTAPTAFNPRTIAALKEIGVEIKPTGREAVRGEPKTANPTYSVRWATDLETTEYSKTYFELDNPQQGFAASHGLRRSGCWAARWSREPLSGGSRCPISNPKIYDGSPVYEAIKYAERRDDIRQAHAQRDDAGAEPDESIIPLSRSGNLPCQTR